MSPTVDESAAEGRGRRGPIKLMVPLLPTAKDLAPLIAKIDEGRRYTNFGPLADTLEHRLAELSGASHAVAISSCSLGLQLALEALALPRGGRVLVPVTTFPASAASVIRAGLEPVLCDVDAATFQLTPSLAGQAAGLSEIAAVLPVAIFGQTQDQASWDAFTAGTGLPVLIDAAGAAGHQTVGRTTSAVFSLHATKLLSAGEGGFVATESEVLAEQVRRASNFGFESGVVHVAGTNAKLSEYHAAVGLAALDAFPSTMERRRTLYSDYCTALQQTGLDEAIDIVTRSEWSATFCVALRRGSIEDVMRLLAANGIETRRWYFPPLHQHPAFAACPIAGPLTVAEGLAGRLLGIPFHLDLATDDVRFVCQTLAEALQ